MYSASGNVWKGGPMNTCARTGLVRGGKSVAEMSRKTGSCAFRQVSIPGNYDLISARGLGVIGRARQSSQLQALNPCHIQQQSGPS